MRTLRCRSLLVLLAVLLPGLASAQGIGDTAAREKQKRQATAAKGKARVITNDDLKKDDDGKTKSETGEGSSPVLDKTPAPTSNYQADRERSSGAPQEGDSREKAVEQAQTQVDSARSAVVAAEARVKELGDKLNPMSPSFIYGMNQTGDAVGEEMRTREALRGAEAELAGAREALVKANRDLEDVRAGRRPQSQSER
jgi:hypothetical protein